MVVKDAKYQRTAVKPDQYPDSMLPEIAFVGRSNVGKSSLINTLLGRRNLARVSGTPGKTREINFYNVDNILFFVDLPGYGYAKVSKEKKKAWGAIIEQYLTTRQQLKAIIMVVDIRHLPTDDDKVMYDWLGAYNMPFLIVASKADKISKSQIKQKTDEIRKLLGLNEETAVIAFSSKTNLGKDEIWGKISHWLKL